MRARDPRLQRELGPQRYCDTGHDQSRNASSSEANQSDLRVVGGNNSTNVSAMNSTVHVLDAGAINRSFDFARDVYDQSMMGIESAIGHVSSAYSTAKAGEQKVLVAGGLIIAGIVAVTALKGMK
jgi:hypothetical protein